MSFYCASLCYGGFEMPMPFDCATMKMRCQMFWILIIDLNERTNWKCTYKFHWIILHLLDIPGDDRLLEWLPINRSHWCVHFVMFRKPCSGYKLKEITGSGIFALEGENGTSESGSANPTPNNKTTVRIYQVYVELLQF